MSAEPPDFFVGYLAPSRRLWRFLSYVAAGLLGVAVGLAIVIVWTQPPRGDGHWDEAGEKFVTGRLVLRPYPAVVTEAGEVVLLVDEWKHGASLGAEHTEGELVAVQGYALRRGDLTVLQLDAPPERQSAATAAAGSAPTVATLTGEIVDAKCWAGAMNPGAGKAHHGCGSLCLIGDIPALFVVTHEDGRTDWYLMGDAQSDGPLGIEARAAVGHRLTLTGKVETIGALRSFKIDMARLNAEL